MLAAAAVAEAEKRESDVSIHSCKSKLAIPRADIYPTPRRSDNDAERAAASSPPPHPHRNCRNRATPPPPSSPRQESKRKQQPTGLVTSDSDDREYALRYMYSPLLPKAAAFRCDARQRAAAAAPVSSVHCSFVQVGS
ncbi:uncharacterized protein LOC107303942 [Oryza brachyantha]|uniref:uncharacterized protein LOC107303942 n=1 Tax=Oryza brachyantha TaxID=4533 RepID=UPI000776AA10|nr:uncharacterized protein LOC107303942 [Oryza brachyantha]